MVGHSHLLGDVVATQPELAPEEQLLDLQQRESGARMPIAAEQAVLLPAPFARRQVVRELPQLPRVAAVDPPCSIPDPEGTREGEY